MARLQAANTAMSISACVTSSIGSAADIGSLQLQNGQRLTTQDKRMSARPRLNQLSRPLAVIVACPRRIVNSI